MSTTNSKERITVSIAVKAPLATVWKCWTAPEHVVQWNHASEDWHTPRATNDLRVGGSFSFRMEAKDDSMGFDFDGMYDNVVFQKRIEYTLGDGRTVEVHFTSDGAETTIAEMFDAEGQNTIERQREGWQAILNNFKKHVEGKS